MKAEEIARVLASHRQIVTGGRARCSSMDCEGIVFPTMMDVFRHLGEIIAGEQ